MTIIMHWILTIIMQWILTIIMHWILTIIMQWILTIIMHWILTIIMHWILTIIMQWILTIIMHWILTIIMQWNTTDGLVPQHAAEWLLLLLAQCVGAVAGVTTAAVIFTTTHTHVHAARPLLGQGVGGAFLLSVILSFVLALVTRK